MLDVTDRKIIALLQEDGRLTNAELATSVGLSQSACHRRVKRLEDQAVIAGYGAFVDRSKVGLSVMGFVSIKLENHSEDLLEAFARNVDSVDEVVACYAISGGGDFFLKIVAKDMEAFSNVALKKIVRIPGVKDTTTNFVLSTLKLNAAWPI